MTEIISNQDFRKMRDSGKVKFRGAGKSKASGIATIKTILKEHGIRFKQEYTFSSERKFRFDFALADFKIAIEYEGTIITKKAATKKSGHLTIGGYAKDCTKYNLAILEGWKVFRYCAPNLSELSRDIIKIKELMK